MKPHIRTFRDKSNYTGLVSRGASQTDPSFAISTRALVDKYLRLPPESQLSGVYDDTEYNLQQLDRLELADLALQEKQKADDLVIINKLKKAAQLRAAEMKPLEPDASAFQELVPPVPTEPDNKKPSTKAD